jgi:hypothetical protein
MRNLSGIIPDRFFVFTEDLSALVGALLNAFRSTDADRFIEKNHIILLKKQYCFINFTYLVKNFHYKILKQIHEQSRNEIKSR